jgi:hypothetical protein
MIRRHKALMAQREQRAANGPSTAAKIAQTAGMARDVTSAAEIGMAGIAAISRDVDDLRAARTAARVTGPLGHALDATSQAAGYVSDRRAGMPTDEAAIKHVGGLGLQTGAQIRGPRIGAALGSEGGPGGMLLGSLLGYAGSKAAEPLGAVLANDWRGWKQLYGDAERGFNRTMSWLNDPRTYVRPRDGY